MGYLWSALIAAAAGLVPVIGYADDAIIGALGDPPRRFGSARQALAWPPKGLRAVRRLAGIAD